MKTTSTVPALWDASILRLVLGVSSMFSKCNFKYNPALRIST